MSEERILHFTLGPVQGFIADARRTRDLWAGSFLLSWLSGNAMVALVDAAKAVGRSEESVIIFPDALTDPMFMAIRKPGSQTPTIGSLPNRFKADVTGIEDPAKICSQGITTAWKALTDKVYNKYVKSAANAHTKAIWDRQVDTFWDVAWVEGSIVAEEENDGAWLDQRKNWRSHIPQAPEPNDLCQQMGTLQEISGFSRVREPKAQAAFWSNLIARSKISSLDLREGERLCAIGLVKRFFPLLAKEAIGWTPGGDGVDIVHWPSLSYIAAVPWLRKAVALENIEQSKYWAEADENVDGNFMGEAATRLFGLPKNGLFKLDGHLLHEDGIRAWPREDLVGDTAAEKADARASLMAGLRAIQGKVGGAASEFYAILIMDGDRIGAKIGDFPDAVKNGLAGFTERVRLRFAPDDKRDAPGVLIYAGGDDVLAILPVDTAISTAVALRGDYRDAFKDAGADPNAFTMSGAIVFTQYKVPLQAALGRSHHYLDAVAKERNGRNSLALAAMKPSGVSFDWVSCWDSEGDGDEGGDAIKHLLEIVEDPNAYSSSFFHNLRDRYAALFDTRGDAAREVEPAFADPELIEKILKAEYLKHHARASQTRNQIAAAVTTLMAVGRPYHRLSGKAEEAERFSFDGNLLASFLSGEIMFKSTNKEQP